MSLQFASRNLLHDTPFKLVAKSLARDRSYRCRLSLGKFTSELNIKRPWTHENLEQLFYRLERPQKSFTCSPAASMNFKAELYDENDKLCDSIDIQRRILHSESKYSYIKNGKFIGHLFVPKTEPGQRLPAIITVGGMGGPRLYRPALLSNHGFVVFEPEYHTTNGMQIMRDPWNLDIFEDYLKFVRNLPCVDPTRIGAMGISRGGELALSMTRTLNRHFDHCIKGVVAVSAPQWNACIAPHIYKGKIETPGALGLVKGLKNDLKLFETMFIPKAAFSLEGLEVIREISKFTMALEHFHKVAGLETFNESSHRMQEVEADVLCIYGELDQNVPGPACHQIARDIIDNGCSNVESILYDRVGHIIDAPYFGWKRSMPAARGGQLMFELGGEQDFHGLAEVDSWNRAIEFFKKRLC